jgi:small conductance mechanosensitive channel
MLALLGTAGLALGLALQGSLSNFAGGVLILVLKPFKVGDYIIEHNRQCEGTVTDIHVFYTKLATPDNRVIVIPNGSLSNNSLTNITHHDKRRLEIILAISYYSNIGKAKEILTEILENEPCRREEEGISVFAQGLEDNCIRMGCRLWVNTEDFWPVRCRLIEQIKEALDQHGIGIPVQELQVSITEQ